MSINAILLIAAFICFVLAAAGISLGPINLGWVGLALWVLTLVGLSELILLVLLVVLIIVLIVVLISHGGIVVTRRSAPPG